MEQMESMEQDEDFDDGEGDEGQGGLASVLGRGPNGGTNHVVFPPVGDGGVLSDGDDDE